MFEYNMSQQMAKELLKNRKGKERNMDPQAYLVEYVNSEFCLLHPVTKVFTTL